MKVHRELVFRGESAAIKNFLTAVTDSLTNGWTRDRSAEKTIGISQMYCFSCDQRSGLPPSNLWIGLDPHRGARVVNVVPVGTGELSFDEYNAIVLDFYRRFIALKQNQFPGVLVHLSDAEAELSNWLTPTTAHLLRRFSDLANKSSGASHPADHERWIDFLIAVHRENSQLSPSDLQRWLYEVGHWPDDQAAELALDYSFARELLKAHDHAI